MKQQQVNGNASRELTFRSQMADLRARKSLNAEEIQELADALSRLWRGKDVLFAARIHRERKMLDSMLDGVETEVITTGVITSPENEEVITTGVITSPLAGGERREREKSPHTPLKEKDQETNNNNNARERGRFVKPTVEEVAAYIKARGYTFDAEQFWSYYESKGWLVGKAPMKSWQAACVTWQKAENRRADTRAGRKSAAPKASNWIGSTAEQRKEFCDGLEG